MHHLEAIYYSSYESALQALATSANIPRGLAEDLAERGVIVKTPIGWLVYAYDSEEVTAAGEALIEHILNHREPVPHYMRKDVKP